MLLGLPKFMVKVLAMTPLKNSDKPIGIKKITKKRSLYYILLDNEDELSLIEDQMVDYVISVNRRFTLDEIEKIKKDSKFNLWYHKALVHISYKLRTKKEIYDFLSKSDLEDNEKFLVIDKLIKHHYIDDLEYAKHFLEDCLNKKRGRRYFSNHLNRLGVNSEIISEILETFDENQLLEGLTLQYQKIQKDLENYPIRIQKLKISEKMARRGISISTINKVLDSISYTEDLTISFEKDLEKIKKKTDDYNKIVNYLLSKGYNYQLIKEKVKN